MFLPESLRLYLPDGNIKRILLEDYLRGVVAAALPADAPLEAQKALAVAARTFAANTHRHLEQGADVCATRHCQAWNERANPRAARAVLETRGIVALSNQQFIEAFYFEHCDGKTRDAKGVLLNAPSYLKSVTCPCGFASQKGHGIGMCLRGMLAMARLGENYATILTHYYSGIALETLTIDTTAAMVEPPASKVKGEGASVKRDVLETLSRPAPRADAPATTPPPTARKIETEKPPRQRIAPRRSPRPKIEQQEKPAEPVSPRVETPPTPAPPSPDARLLLDAHSPEEDDLLLFLAVEDVKPTETSNQSSVVSNQSFGAAQAKSPLFHPPDSIPEEIPTPEMFAAPPSMPEELPNASVLDFIAPPPGGPEDLIGAPPPELLKPAAHIVEPDLAEFIPPIEKFYAPLDAPPTMPEALPSFETAGADETPFAWVPPPPIQESAFGVSQARVLMDSLPGPRVIAGNLPKAGMLVTIRDARGNSIVTVSGVAKQYGSGGFEAPLTDDGAYQVKFDGTELDVRLENETVFIYYP